MKVLFDTNLFISAFIVPGGRAETAFRLARRRSCELYVSVAILAETAQKLRNKFNQPERDIEEALRMIGRSAKVLKPTSNVTLLEDLPDNRILECAIEGRVDLVVTGDRHLLKLRKFENIPIVRLADFLRMFPADLLD
jgi:putative PIN family toxin of toxin-antitoxin system